MLAKRMGATRGHCKTHFFYYFGNTLMCLSIGTPKAINFPFVSNEKLMFFRCPNIQQITMRQLST